MTEAIRRTQRFIKQRRRWRKHFGNASYPTKQEDREDPTFQEFVKKRLEGKVGDVKAAKQECENIKIRLRVYQTGSKDTDRHLDSIRHFRASLARERIWHAEMLIRYRDAWRAVAEAGMIQEEWGTSKQFLDNYDPFPRR